MDGLRHLNLLADDEMRAAFRRCCGSGRWVEAMVAARPFATRLALHEAASRAWRALDRRDWLEAFSHHPRIGDGEALRARFAGTWSGGEQAAAAGASEETLRDLVAANGEYERQFGHIFVVCATGRSAQEMLADLRRRLDAAPAAELETAAAEQEKITALRLDKLLAEEDS